MLDTSQGLIVITGCAHPGIIHMIKEIKKQLKKPIYLVLGGFHLAASGEKEVKKIIAEFRQLGVVCSAPCHCTGKRAIGQFEAGDKNGFILVTAGCVINL